MNTPWHDWLAIGLSLVAGGYLARRLWLAGKGTNRLGCGSCSHCPAGGEEAPSDLVQLRPTSRATQADDSIS